MPNPCISCRQPQATLRCDACEEPVCKKCVQTLAADTFSFLKKIPTELTHTTYCGLCYDKSVAPALESYNETMERAKDVFIFYKTQRKEIPLIRRSKEVFKVKDCIDRDETILRLAFFAAEQNYNAVIETEVLSDKVRNAGYQKSVWRGEGSPAQVDGGKIDRQDRQNLIYR
jgi:hypothetical protein